VRQMSFAMTTEAVLERRKTVTRRLGWKNLQVGTLLQPVEKAQGLPKGARVRKIGGPIRVVRVTPETLQEFLERSDAKQECIREGFPVLTPREFADFLALKYPLAWKSTFTRIEFEYVEASVTGEVAR
jgi:hypothetical protein